MVLFNLNIKLFHGLSIYFFIHIDIKFKKRRSKANDKCLQSRFYQQLNQYLFQKSLNFSFSYFWNLKEYIDSKILSEKIFISLFKIIHIFLLIIILWGLVFFNFKFLNLIFSAIFIVYNDYKGFYISFF